MSHPTPSPAAAPGAAPDAPRGYTVVPHRPELEAGVVRALQAAFPNGWGTPADWRWKQPARPGFLPEDAWVAVADGGDAAGQVIGCYSTTPLPIRLGGGVEVAFSFDGDLAVTPAARGRGVPAAIRDASERWFLDPRPGRTRVALRGGFTTPGLNERVYHPLYGLTFVPNTAVEFRKTLGLAPLGRHVEQLGVRALARPRVAAALRRRPLVVNLRVDGLDDASLVLAPDGFRFTPGHAARAHLTVRLPASVLAAARGGVRALTRTLAREAARGQMRVSGLARSGPRLAALAWALARAG